MNPHRHFRWVIKSRVEGIDLQEWKDLKGTRGPTFHTESVDYMKQVPEEVVEMGTMVTFKRVIDRYMNSKGLE